MYMYIIKDEVFIKFSFTPKKKEKRFAPVCVLW